jgi:outer membrane murein-binding lipoprotein Lpp
LLRSQVKQLEGELGLVMSCEVSGCGSQQAPDADDGGSDGAILLGGSMERLPRQRAGARVDVVAAHSGGARAADEAADRAEHAAGAASLLLYCCFTALLVQKYKH